MSNMNVVAFNGYVCTKPELKEDEKAKVTVFRVAIREVYKKQPRTTFVGVVAFNSLAEMCVKYLTVGSGVGITGKLRSSEFVNEEKKRITRLDVVAQDVEFIHLKKVEEQTNVEES